MKNPRSGSSQSPRSSAPAAKRLKGKYNYCDDTLAHREGKYSWCDDELPSSESEYSTDESQSSYDKLPDEYECEIRANEMQLLFGSRESRKELLLTYHVSSLVVESTAVEVYRYCVEPHTSVCLPAKSFKGTWVAVHGVDSICAVTRDKDLARLERELKTPDNDLDHKYFIHCFWNTIISTVEDIAGPSGESDQMSNKSSKKPFGAALADISSDKPCQMLHKSSKKPFGVVSVIAGSNKVHEAFIPRHGEEKAIKFLQEEMKSGTTFTFEKTAQTAISAFQHLFRQKFEADEIRAFVLKNDDCIGKELKQERERFDIEEVISFINGCLADTV